MEQNEILKEYDGKAPEYERFKDCVIGLLGSLIRKTQVVPHSVSGRVKERGSLDAKLKEKGDKYDNLSDITDIAGIRVILHLVGDIDLITELIESEFAIDEENSVDKRIYDHPDKFGYKSLHYVVGLNKSRLALSEYSEFAGMKA